MGERYGFRLESGRSGPRGNERLARLLAQLETLHAREPLDAILITGDMTDAGTLRANGPNSSMPYCAIPSLPNGC